MRKLLKGFLWAITFLAGCALLFTIIIVIYDHLPSPPPAPPYVEQLTKEQKDYFAELHEQQFLDLEEANHRAFIAPALWFQLDIHVKEKFAAALGAACADKARNTSENYIELIDRQSGKKLATYSRFSGFKIE